MKNTTDDQSGRELVAKACRIIGSLNLNKAATGHISQRAADGSHILIRGRGPDDVGIRFTTANEAISVDFDGQKVDGRDGITPPQ